MSLYAWAAGRTKPPGKAVLWGTNAASARASGAVRSDRTKLARCSLHGGALLREGFVTEEFIELVRAEDRTDDQERRLDTLKSGMAERVMGQPADEVYDVVS